jgi:hypothetical protein
MIEKDIDSIDTFFTLFMQVFKNSLFIYERTFTKNDSTMKKHFSNINMLLLIITGMMLMALDANAQTENKTTSLPNPVVPKKGIHSLAVEVGPAWITSKMYTPSGKYTWRTGMELGGEYTYSSPKGWGIGFAYMHNKTSYPDADIKLDYIGPSLIYGGEFSARWRAKVSLGLGYASINDGDDVTDIFSGVKYHSTQEGLGTRFTAGIEYVITEHFGIGATLQNITLYLGKRHYYYPGSKDDINGVDRWSLNLGLHLYL